MRTTCIDPEYTRTQASPVIVDGVEFYAYRVGILKYARISADGQCEVRANSMLTTWSAYTAKNGYVGKNGKAKRFRSEMAAMKAAVLAVRQVNADRGE